MTNANGPILLETNDPILGFLISLSLKKVDVEQTAHVFLEQQARRKSQLN